jgi:hypothetical protein
MWSGGVQILNDIIQKVVKLHGIRSVLITVVGNWYLRGNTRTES